MRVYSNRLRLFVFKRELLRLNAASDLLDICHQVLDLYSKPAQKGAESPAVSQSLPQPNPEDQSRQTPKTPVSVSRSLCRMFLRMTFSLSSAVVDTSFGHLMELIIKCCIQAACNLVKHSNHVKGVCPLTECCVVENCEIVRL